jgi:hypothetical protein
MSGLTRIAASLWLLTGVLAGLALLVAVGAWITYVSPIVLHGTGKNGTDQLIKASPTLFVPLFIVGGALLALSLAFFAIGHRGSRDE